MELDLGTDESRWSVALYEILGLTADPALGPSTYTARIHPGDLARVAVALDGVRREGLRLDVEHRIVRPDASVRLVRLRAWRSGDASTLVALVEDVTSHAAITDRLSSVRRRSPRAWRTRLIIRSGSSRRTLELIALETHVPDGTPEEQARARELDVLVREARHGRQRIRTVVRGLMTFSRIEPTHHEPLDVNRVMEVAIGITASEIRPRAQLVRIRRRAARRCERRAPRPGLRASAAQRRAVDPISWQARRPSDRGDDTRRLERSRADRRDR